MIEFQEKDESTILVTDRIEGRQFPLITRPSGALEPVSCDRFRDPVDRAVSCRIAQLELPYVVPIFVRDSNGETVAECHEFATLDLPAEEYELEITAPIKLFLRISGAVRIESTSDGMEITLEGTKSVDIAARSYHEHPATTVTTTSAPEDLMTAVSTFGSALKTTSPERSLPSLRGHPPTIQLGEAVSVPDEIAPPQTGLRIEIPRDRESVYTVATLAHYLGARVIPGDDAKLLADGEVIRTLDGRDGLQGAATETLQQTLLFDCATRTVGKYPMELHEERKLAERVSLPLRDLYDAPIAERVTRYLDVPFETVADLVPRWYLSTHLSPEPDSAELLSYAANALSTVHVEHQETSGPRAERPPGYETFIRSTTAPPDPAERSPDSTYVRVSETDTLESAWFGDDRAVNANDLSLKGVRNRDSSRSTGGPIEIVVVCNDKRMTAELDDGNLYGNRDELPFDVTVQRDLTREELRTLLATDLDFVHYIGHVDRGGFVCRDGTLDANELETVGVDTFVLNGCRSYDQGQLLIDRGSVGGIVTHGAVDNKNATAVGRTVAGLLDTGYSLRSSLGVARRLRLVNGNYSVIGDGGIQLAQSESGTPNLLEISKATDGQGYEVEITTYPTLGTAMGACYTPYAPSIDRYYLTGGTLPTITLSLPEVVNLLALECVPTIIDEEFWWSVEVSPGDLP